MTQIIFKNGMTLSVTQNASTYTAPERPDFPEDLTDITIIGDEGRKTIANGMIVDCYAEGEGYHFAIIEKPYQMVLEEKLSEQDDIICELLLNA